jgi:hypothetical protein
VGFTVALFVTSLAFDDAVLADAAKVGILVGSILSGVVGYLVLRTSPEVALRPDPGTGADRSLDAGADGLDAAPGPEVPVTA